MTKRDAQSFDAIAGKYDRFGELVGKGFQEYFLNTVSVPDNQGRALDLGCGSGHHTSLLADHYAYVLGIDISKPMLELAHAKRSRPNIDYQHRDLCDVTAERDGTFDLVFSVFTLHHVADLDAALRQISSLVAPGGQVFIIDNFGHQTYFPRRVFRTYAFKELARDLIGRRRPVGEAWELCRLWNYSGWLDHLTSDRFLSREQFEQKYHSAFPGAEITQLMQFGLGMYWQNGGNGDRSTV